MTPSAAFDEMADMLRVAWAANSSAANGSDGTPDLLWSNVDSAGEPPVVEPWARATIQHLGGYQCTMGPGGAIGGRRFERTGMVTVQVFVPVGDGVTRGLDLAKVALDAFEGKHSPGGIWFYDCQVVNVGRHRSMDNIGRERLTAPDPWEQVQALCSFTYYDTK